jgi:hypothetical protein
MTDDQNTPIPDTNDPTGQATDAPVSTTPVPDPPPADDPAPEPETDGPEKKGPAAEAARYRTRLREVEAERDQLAVGLSTMRRGLVDGALYGLLKVPPATFWADEADPTDYVADDGTLDLDKVAARVNAARTQFGIPPLEGTEIYKLTRHGGDTRKINGLSNGGPHVPSAGSDRSQPTPDASWSSVLRDRHRTHR